MKGSLRAIELFAGVGGFRVGLEKSDWKVVWSNQYEPSSKTRQHASWIYKYQFGESEDNHVNLDINEVLDQMSNGGRPLPQEHDLLVGGFPCQDYSVARVLNQAAGLIGQKGVLWWSIFRLLKLLRSQGRQPRFLLLENVDRLIKSPAGQRGRDFAVMLASLQLLGYRVEWRVINAADYGFPQRRRRIFIVGEMSEYSSDDQKSKCSPKETLFQDGILAQALNVQQPSGACQFDLKTGFPLSEKAIGKLDLLSDKKIQTYLGDISAGFGIGTSKSPFRNAGLLINGQVHTVDLKAIELPESERHNLRHVVQKAKEYRLENNLDEDVEKHFYLDEGQLGKWEVLKGPKNAERTHRVTGHQYFYQEGRVAFPDSLEKPSRTILTGEGGSTPSRFKHVIEDSNGLRRLTPEELEILNGFDPGHTKTPPDHPVITDGKRAFLMGNAVVVGIVEKIGLELDKRMKASKNRKSTIEEYSHSTTPEELVATPADY